MTEYFEVHGRDGGARLAEVRLTEPVTTPALADDFVVDSGSAWASVPDTPDGDEGCITVLPHRGLPTGTREEVRDVFQLEHEDVPYPSAVVMAPGTEPPGPADIYIMSGLAGIRTDPRRLLDAILTTRQTIPPDTGLYAPGIATPAALPVLAYAGVDLIDCDRVVVDGSQGLYLTPEGASSIEDLTELPCACSICREETPDSIDRDGVIDHNVASLEATIARVREAIRAGRLREYLEGQVRHTPWLTAALRNLEAEWQYLEMRSPIATQSDLAYTTEDALRRVDVQRFADRIRRRVVSRLDSYPLVLLPCSATKPYSESPSHRDFREAIDYRGHIVSLTSPLGVVPDELELTFPAQHYDTAVTGQWSADERDRVTTVLSSVLERSSYPTVIAHVPPEGYRPAVERAFEDHPDLDVTFTVDDHPRDPDALAELAGALDGRPQYSRPRRHAAIVQAIADYQFGDGAGDDLFGDADVSGRYPRLRVFDRDGDQLATLVPQYGLLALTLEGARHWMASAADTKRVEIEAFVPHGSVLAPGVVGADAAIRVGDEVVIEGPSAVGVGRAQMFGKEMVESTRGIAVDVRHVEER